VGAKETDGEAVDGALLNGEDEGLYEGEADGAIVGEYEGFFEDKLGTDDGCAEGCCVGCPVGRVQRGKIFRHVALHPRYLYENDPDADKAGLVAESKVNEFLELELMT